MNQYKWHKYVKYGDMIQTVLLVLLYSNIDQKLVSLLHGLLNCEIGGLGCHVNTTEYRTRVLVYTCNTYFVMHWSM